VNQADTNQADTNQADTNQADTNQADTNQADTNQADTNQADTNQADTNQPDTNEPDTNLPDTNLPDTNLPDTNLPDTNLPDTNLPDTNLPDSACNSLNPSGAPVVTPTDSPNPAPTLAGGAFPTSGTWHLTDMTYYLPDGGSSGTHQTLKMVVEIAGTVANQALVTPAASPQVISETDDITNVNTVAGTYTSSATCGGAGNANLTYGILGDAGAGQQLVVTPDGTQYLTFTLQP
jgi:hypothetical protein